MDYIYDANMQQRNFWAGKFGDFYINRNKTIDEVNESYEKETGVTVEKIFHEFFDKIDRKSKILELGCNVGLNLEILQKMGFSNLYGLELNKKALEIARERYPKITFINSSIEVYESKMTYDLVYTAGVLIHINPSTLNSIIKKIVSLTKEYIFGFEYYADSLVEIKYRGYSNVCWKQNFPLLFQQLFNYIDVVKEEKFHYKNKDLTDIAYLLRKKRK